MRRCYFLLLLLLASCQTLWFDNTQSSKLGFNVIVARYHIDSLMVSLDTLSSTSKIQLGDSLNYSIQLYQINSNNQRILLTATQDWSETSSFAWYKHGKIVSNGIFWTDKATNIGPDSLNISIVDLNQDTLKQAFNFVVNDTVGSSP